MAKSKRIMLDADGVEAQRKRKKCPYCGSTKASQIGLDRSDKNTIVATFSCEKCDKYFAEFYSLSEVEALPDPE